MEFIKDLRNEYVKVKNAIEGRELEIAEMDKNLKHGHLHKEVEEVLINLKEKEEYKLKGLRRRLIELADTLILEVL